MKRARLKPTTPEEDPDERLDRGAYLLFLRVGALRLLGIGSLGELEFPAGWYVYVGSAMRNLEARVARHMKTKKKLRWHIDYLREASDSCEALLLPSTHKKECEIARILAAVLTPRPRGFGSSDCRCPTHLFRLESEPGTDPGLRKALYRMQKELPSLSRAECLWIQDPSATCRSGSRER